MHNNSLEEKSPEWEQVSPQSGKSAFLPYSILHMHFFLY